MGAVEEGFCPPIVKEILEVQGATCTCLVKLGGVQGGQTQGILVCSQVWGLEPNVGCKGSSVSRQAAADTLPTSAVPSCEAEWVGTREARLRRCLMDSVGWEERPVLV